MTACASRDFTDTAQPKHAGQGYQVLRSLSPVLEIPALLASMSPSNGEATVVVFWFCFVFANSVESQIRMLSVSFLAGGTF